MVHTVFIDWESKSTLKIPKYRLFLLIISLLTNTKLFLIFQEILKLSFKLYKKKKR